MNLLYREEGAGAGQLFLVWELSPQTAGGWPSSVITAARYVIHETSPNRRRKGGTYFID